MTSLLPGLGTGFRSAVERLEARAVTVQRQAKQGDSPIPAEGHAAYFEADPGAAKPHGAHVYRLHEEGLFR